MQTMLTIVAVIVALLVVLALIASVADRIGQVTVFENERGVRYDRGRFTGVLPAGRYRFWRSRTKIETIDLRPRVVTVPSQEVLSSDGVTLRLSLAASWSVEDPARALHQSQDYQVALYVALQLALRQVVGTAPIDDVIERRAELGPRVRELVTPTAETLGLMLEAVDVRDIMFPGDLKRLFAQIVQARKEGQAALEKARGETAALRSLANAARMVDASPALLQLRLLQQLAGSSGNTIVLGVGGLTTPIRAGDGEQPQVPPPPAADS